VFPTPRPNAEPWATWPAASPSRPGPAAKPLSRPWPSRPLRTRAFPSPLWAERPMSSTVRRFEILLPLRYNDGSPVPEDLVGETLLELREWFGAVCAEPRINRGHGPSEGPIGRDELVRVFIDAPDTPTSRDFFTAYKEQLKARFRQPDIR